MSIDDLLGRLVKADPQAHVILTVQVDNTMAKGLTPWVDKHSEEVAHDEAGNTILTPWPGWQKSRLPCFASKVWLKDTADMLRALARHIGSGPYADRVIAYQPVGGITAEWHYWGATCQEFLDYSRPFQVAFQEWAKRKYDGNLEMLNQSWHKQFASFDEVCIPTKSERLRTDIGDLLDPQRSQYVIDYVQCVSDVVSDAIIYFCKAIKDETGGRSLTGVYYGYTLFVCGPYLQHLTGHFALEKVLDSPYVDYVISPPRYLRPRRGWRSRVHDTGGFRQVAQEALLLRTGHPDVLLDGAGGGRKKPIRWRTPKPFWKGSSAARWWRVAACDGTISARPGSPRMSG